MAILTLPLMRARSSERSSGWHLVHRNFLTYRASWAVFLTGFLEPVFYLFSIGIGVGAMIDGFELNGRTVGYAAFVAPGMLAASAMNGAVLDSTYNLFFKLKYTSSTTRFWRRRCAPATSPSVTSPGPSARGRVRPGFLVLMAAMGLTAPGRRCWRCRPRC